MFDKRTYLAGMIWNMIGWLIPPIKHDRPIHIHTYITSINNLIKNYKLEFMDSRVYFF